MARWLSFKIMHSPGEQGERTDTLLLNCIRPACSELCAASLTDRWFFLRYFDADGFQVRLRLFSAAPHVHGNQVASRLTRWVERHPWPVTLVTATYFPELSKYGGAQGLAIAEEQFTVSSQFALAAVEQTRNAWGARLILAAHAMRWTVATLVPQADAQRTAIRAYAAYWRKLHNSTNRQAAASSHLATLWRDRLRDAPADLLDDLGLSGAHGTWQARTQEALEHLVELDAVGLLRVAPVSVGLNLAHTFHNRLGLSIGSELVITDLLLCS